MVPNVVNSSTTHNSSKESSCIYFCASLRRLRCKLLCVSCFFQQSYICSENCNVLPLNTLTTPELCFKSSKFSHYIEKAVPVCKKILDHNMCINTLHREELQAHFLTALIAFCVVHSGQHPHQSRV